MSAAATKFYLSCFVWRWSEKLLSVVLLNKSQHHNKILRMEQLSQQQETSIKKRKKRKTKLEETQIVMLIFHFTNFPHGGNLLELTCCLALVSFAKSDLLFSAFFRLQSCSKTRDLNCNLYQVKVFVGVPFQCRSLMTKETSLMANGDELSFNWTIYIMNYSICDNGCCSRRYSSHLYLIRWLSSTHSCFLLFTQHKQKEMKTQPS